MAYYAVSCLGDALDATREFLFPFDASRWARLVVVVFFLGVTSSGGSGQGVSGQIPANGVGWPGGFPAEAQFADLLDAVWPLLVVLGLALAVLGIGFLFVGSVMEFVLVDAVATETVAVRAAFRRYLRQGAALFVFRLVLGALVAAVLGVGFLLVVLPALSGSDAAVAAGLLVFVPLALFVGLLALLVHGLTVEFVVPTMLSEDSGLVAGWRRFWPTLRGNLGQFAVYALVRIGLTILFGIVVAIALGLVGLVLAIPFVLVGALVFVAAGGLSLASGVVLGVLVAIYLFALLVATSVVQVPIQTYVRYYELLVLGDVDPDLDLVEARRSAIREATAT